MPNRTSTTGSELFIVDNSDVDWKVVRYLHDWCQISKAIDCATGNFEIGALLALDNEWQKVDQFRILMGSEVTPRTKNAFLQALDETKRRLDTSIEVEKERNEFLKGVPDIVEGIRSGKIACRVYRKEKFHAKAYITHARMEVVGSAALVGSSNFEDGSVTSPAVRIYDWSQKINRSDLPGQPSALSTWRRFLGIASSWLGCSRLIPCLRWYFSIAGIILRPGRYRLKPSSLPPLPQ